VRVDVEGLPPKKKQATKSYEKQGMQFRRKKRKLIIQNRLLLTLVYIISDYNHRCDI
jgi:hypothetical protein